ncbi:MAG: hypothetical protein JST40_02670 [Armatimonadetes bacterium]|nr:hypothetical protein [Armatimonadota bacterium]
MKSKLIKRTAVALVATMLAGVAFAWKRDVTIDRAVNSPIITVKFKDVRATLVEFFINGVSAGTRAIGSDETAGAVEFKLDTDLLEDGDNKIEARLYDSTGKLVATESSTIRASVADNSPISLQNLSSNEKVQGAVELKLEIDREFKEMYVSFFINGAWKAMRNTPPFTYTWDTTLYPNGWHEVQAWLVDEDNHTFKTKKIKVFVNNPGGRTDRTMSVTTAAGTTAIKTAPEAVKTVANTATAVAVPARLVSTTITAIVGKTKGLQHVKPLPGIQTDQRILTPTGKRVVAPKVTTPVAKPVAPKVQPPKVVAPKPVAPKVVAPKAPKTTLPKVTAPVVKPAANAASAAKTVAVAYGTRLPNIGSYSILMNGKPVSFDVLPKVVKGIPFTPFRYLFEEAGGKVKWSHSTKVVTADGLGKEIIITIGERRALIDQKWVNMELAAYIEGSRTIVPLSFIKDSLNVNVDFDPETNHVLITNKK